MALGIGIDGVKHPLALVIVASQRARSWGALDPVVERSRRARYPVPGQHAPDRSDPEPVPVRGDELAHRSS